MKALLWRVIYAVVCVVIFLLVVPVFLRVIGVPMGGDLWELIRVCVACIAPRSNVVDSQP